MATVGIDNKIAVIWEWQDNVGVWQAYESHVSEFIEQNSDTEHKRNIKLGLTEKSLSNYVVNAENETQRNIHGGVERKVRRRVLDDSVSFSLCDDGKEIIWERKYNRQWKEYPLHVTCFIEEHRNSIWKNNIRLGLVDVAFAEFEINVVTNEELNTTTGDVVEIRRREVGTLFYSSDKQEYNQPGNEPATVAAAYDCDVDAEDVDHDDHHNDDPDHDDDKEVQEEGEEKEDEEKETFLGIWDGRQKCKSYSRKASRCIENDNSLKTNLRLGRSAVEDNGEKGDEGKEIIWEFQDGQQWWPYDRKVSRYIEKNRYTSWKNNIQLGRISSKLSSYVLDIDANVQTNIYSGKRRGIRRTVVTAFGNFYTGPPARYERCGTKKSSLSRSKSFAESDFDRIKSFGESDFDRSKSFVESAFDRRKAFVESHLDRRLSYMKSREVQQDVRLPELSSQLPSPLMGESDFDRRKSYKKPKGTRHHVKFEMSPSPQHIKVEQEVEYLKPSTTEYDFIKGLVKHSRLYDDNQGRDAINLHHGKLDVVDVVKVKNSKLFQGYEKRLKGINDIVYPSLSYQIRTTNYRRRYGEIVGIDPKKEVLLFHGTRYANVDSIARNGFQLSKASDKSMYGRCIYLSDCSQKADQYCDEKDKRSSGELAMFLSRVALGTVGLHGNSNCDSTIAGTAVNDRMRFYEILIKDETQIYPQYIIKYKRI